GVRRALGETATAAPGLSDWLVSGVVAVAVAAAVIRWGSPRWPWAADWFGLQRLVDRVVTAPVRQGSARLAQFDDRVVDRGVMSLATGIGVAGRRSADWDDRVVDATVEATARAFRRAGSLARRPQTGQVHQYYLMTALLLMAAVGALVVFG
ncbi:MAG: NADH-quinone oxidoreductase subunit L, partial [Nakamurella sp.]